MATANCPNHRVLEPTGFGKKKPLLASPTEVGEEPITRPPYFSRGTTGGSFLTLPCLCNGTKYHSGILEIR